MKKLLNAVPTKAAVATSLMVLAGTALAQTGNEAAITAAIDTGTSAVTLVVGGLIGIAAVVLGIGIIMKLMSR